MLSYPEVFLLALIVFVGTSVLWRVAHSRARGAWLAGISEAEAKAGARAEAMRYCPSCQRRLKKLLGSTTNVEPQGTPVHHQNRG